jgi:hypothetical protein
VIQKEKNNKNKKMFSGKRFVLSLVFLCLAWSFFNSGFNFKNKNLSFSTKSLAQLPGPVDESGNVSSYTGMSEDIAKNQASANSIKAPSGIGGMVWEGFLNVINSVLYVVFKFVMALVYIMAIVFDWAVSAENFKTVMNMSAIKTGWTIVRDFLNIFFILILLFSAFCTIFQVEKYHIKKILLTLVIMALLVNFSFPIARAVIDAGNIPMYYFLKVLGGDGGSISKNLWNTTNGNGKQQRGLEAIILPNITKPDEIKGNTDQTFGLLAAISFSFLFMITLAVIAILLVIRILVLAILVMFSPVGFTAAIFPSFSKYADDWWGQLFKQSFFGTIMAFMLYMALMVMNEAQNNGIMTTLESKAAGGMTGNVFDSIIVSGITLIIPIVLLWIGIIAAQKLATGGSMISINGLKTAAKRGKKVIQGGWRTGAWGLRKSLTKKDENGNVKFRSSHLNNLLGDTKVGSLFRRSSAKADVRKASKDKYKNYGSMLNSMSASDREAEFKSQSGYKKFLAAQAVVKAGQHKKMDNKDLNNLHRALSDHGDVDNVKKLTEDRWDADIDIARMAADPAYANDARKILKSRIKKAKSSGDHKKITSDKMLSTEFLNELSHKDVLGIDSMNHMIGEMQDSVREKIAEGADKELKSMATSGTNLNDLSNTDVINWRKIGAASSVDDPRKFFAAFTGGDFEKDMCAHPTFMKEAQKFFDKMPGKQIANYSADALPDIGMVISTTTALEQGSRFFSSEQAKKFKEGAELNSNANVKNFVGSGGNKFWASV